MRIASIYVLSLLFAASAIGGVVDIDAPADGTNATWGFSDALAALGDNLDAPLDDAPLGLLAETTGTVATGPAFDMTVAFADKTSIVGLSVQTAQAATDLLILGPRSLSTTW